MHVVYESINFSFRLIFLFFFSFVNFIPVSNTTMRNLGYACRIECSMAGPFHFRSDHQRNTHEQTIHAHTHTHLQQWNNQTEWSKQINEWIDEWRAQKMGQKSEKKSVINDWNKKKHRKTGHNLLMMQLFYFSFS